MDLIDIGPLDRADVMELRKALTGRVIAGSRARGLAAFLDVRIAQSDKAAADAFAAELAELPAFAPDAPRPAHGGVRTRMHTIMGRWQ